jgi:cytochrome c556
MANNLVVSYDLNNPGQNYEKVIAAVKCLGSWAKVHKSVCYVSSTYNATQAVDKLWAVMDANDSVFVVDANNQNAAWQSLSAEVANHIREQWLQ